MKNIYKVLLLIFIAVVFFSRSLFLFEFLKAETLFHLFSNNVILIRSADIPIGYSEQLQPYDRLVSIDGITFQNFSMATSYVQTSDNETMRFTIKRGQENKDVVVSTQNNETDTFGFRFTDDRHMYGLELPQSNSNYWIFKNYSFFLLIIETIFIVFCFLNLYKDRKIGYYLSSLYLILSIFGSIFLVY